MSRSTARRSILAGLAVLLGLVLGVPAAALVSVSTSDALELQTGERVVRLRLSRGVFSGPKLQLQLTASGLGGSAYGLPVRLGFSRTDRIVGQVGPDPVQLDVRQEFQGVDVRGTFAGQQSNLHIWPTTLSGTIGWCRYSLVLSGDQYSGWRSCGSSVPVATTLRLPAAMAPMSDVERAAVLAILLARE